MSMYVCVCVRLYHSYTGKVDMAMITGASRSQCHPHTPPFVAGCVISSRCNVGITIINIPTICGDECGMVYYCYTHIHESV